MDRPETDLDTNDAGVTGQPPPPPPQIPWENRKQIGSFGAYWRTAIMVMFRPNELERILDTPVCEKHAKQFRRVTVQLTFVITLGVLAVWTVRTFRIGYAPGFYLGKLESLLQTAFLRMALAVLLLIGLFLSTRSLEWFSSPGDLDPTRRGRAISLSCYACCPILVVTAVGALVSLAIIMTGPAGDMITPMKAINLTWGAIFLAWWPAAVRAIHFTTGRNAKRTATAAILLPLIWAGQQLMVVLVPMSVVQWYLMALSLP